MRKLVSTALTAAAILVVSAAMGVWGPAPAQAHSAPSCAVTWGSQPKTTPAMTTAEIFDVRAGRHTCFDRLVVDVAGSVKDAYDARYVPRVIAEGSGDVVPLRGGAFLQVAVRAPVAPTDSFFVSPGNLVNVSSYRTFRQVGWGGSFEGYTVIGLGVRARLPFRVFVIPGPGNGSRLVVDVAHRW